ncbi:hypothetical protein BT69DRAFT_1276565 [Atractiella rhizophila]|nr:hypothetical protein BT69DRAFT_1276565 [Atractiella rhizophila]
MTQEIYASSRNTSPQARFKTLEPSAAPSTSTSNMASISQGLMQAFPPIPSNSSLHSTTGPPSPSYWHGHLADVVGGLYYCDGGNREEWDLWSGMEAGWRRKRRKRIGEVVGRCYEGEAVFENPITCAIGRDLITRHFGLLALVPGRLWSEIVDVCESDYYDHTRLMILTHVLHISLFPARQDPKSKSTPSVKRLNRSISTISFGSFSGPLYRYRAAGSTYHPSAPATPFPQTPQGYGTPDHYFSRSRSQSIRSQAPPVLSPCEEESTPHFSSEHEREASSKRRARKRSTLKSNLRFCLLILPFVLFLMFIRWIFGPVTIHLKLHTRLVFNESGKICHHEDVWGVREFVEAFVLPNKVGRLFYGVWRRLVGESVGIAITTLSDESVDGDRPSLEAARQGSVTPRQGLSGSGERSPPTFLRSVRKSLEDFAAGVRRERSWSNVSGLQPELEERDQEREWELLNRETSASPRTKMISLSSQSKVKAPEPSPATGSDNDAARETPLIEKLSSSVNRKN